MLFSIITITKNNLGGLEKTAESLREQSFQAFEWIVIDGASTDGTPAWAHENIMAGQFHSAPDNGLYDAMNKGIEAAQGFYILFLNAGDRLADPGTLENIASYLQDVQETPDFIYGDALEDRTTPLPPAYKPARPYKKAARGMFTHHQAMLYRNDRLATLRYDQSFRIAADYKFTLAYLQQADTVLYCPFPLCLFEKDGLSQQQSAAGRREQYQIRKDMALVSPAHNMLITGLQGLASAVKKIMPGIYWQLRSSGNNPAASTPSATPPRHPENRS